MDGASLMFLQRHFKNTLVQVQSISETARVKNGTLPAVKRTSIGIGCRPLTCQFIEGTPTKQEMRRLGSDAFKCGQLNAPGAVYCEAHCLRCYQPLPLTDKPQP